MIKSQLLNIRSIFLWLILISSFDVFSQGIPGKDCNTALRLCNTSTRNDTLTEADPYNIGIDDLAGGDSVCWSNGETRPFWYNFVAANTGPFEFTAIPRADFLGSPSGFNYAMNWAIYDVTNGCNPGPATLVACLEPGTGPTGIRNGSVNPNFISPINLQAGNSYALVLNFSVPTGFFDIFTILNFNTSSLPSAVQFQGFNAGFTSSADTVCPGQIITFNDTSQFVNTSVGYVWDFGDGSTNSIAASPTHSYSASGTYIVDMAINSDNCSGSAQKTLVVRNIAVTIDPVADLCEGAPAVTLTGSPIGGTFSGAGVFGNQFDPSTTGTGTFVVTYTFTNADGCTNSAQTSIDVVSGVDVILDQNSTNLCPSDTATFNASNALSYQWSVLGSPAIISTNSTFVVSPATTTLYLIRGENAAGCFDIDTVIVNINPAPVVDASPLSPTICEGESINLTASGADTYLWFEVGNATPIGNTSVISVTPTASIDYFAVGTVTATGCFDTSVVINLVVDPAPVVDANPASSTICEGESVSLTASGADTYQWFEVGNATSISNSTVLNISPITTTNYFVIGTVTATGCFDTSSVVTVNVDPVPVVDANPASSTICEGESASLTASGADTYLWFEVGNATSIGNTSVISLSPLTTTDYFVIGTVTATGCFDTSSVVTINVNPTPAVNATPDANPICTGATSNLTATGADTYLWFEVGNATPIGNTSVISVTPTASIDYFAVGTVTASGCFDTSVVINLVVDPAPVVDANPASSTICEGESVSLTASGADTYQWFEVGNATSISNSTVLNISPITTTNYFVIGTVTATGCFDTSSVVTVNVDPAPVVDANPASSTICEGESASLTASGADTYLWFEVGNATSIGNTSVISLSPLTTTDYFVVGTVTASGCFDTSSVVTINVNPTPAVNATPDANPICTGATSNLTATGADTYLWFEVGNATPIGNTSVISVTPTASIDYFAVGTVTATGCFDTSVVINLVVDPAPVVDANPASSTICEGESVSLTASGADTYQWFEVGNATSISNSTVLNISPITTTNYFVIGTVTATGCFDTSSVVTVNVDPVPVVDANPASSTICEGESASLTASGADTYLWFEVGNATSIGNTSVISLSPLTTTDYFVVGTVTATGCFDTAFVTLTVNPIPTVTAVADVNPICTGSSTNLTAGGALNYEWFEVGNPVAFTTTASTSVTPATSTDYFVIGTSASGCIDSAFITIFVSASVTPTVSLAFNPSSVCLGDTVFFTTGSTGGGISPSYQWFVNGALQSGFVNDAYFDNSLNPGDEVKVILTSSLTCATATSADSVLPVILNSITPTVVVNQDNPGICETDTARFTAAPTNGGISPSFAWHVNGVLQSGFTTSNFEAPNLSSGDFVKIEVTSSLSCASGIGIDSVAANTVAAFTPSASLAQNPSPVCTGDTTTISAIVANGGASPVFQWSLNGAVQASVTGTSFISDAFANGDIVQLIVTPTETCVTGPDTATIAVNISNAIIPTVSIVQTPDPSCFGDAITFNAVSTGQGISPSFVWTVNSVIQTANSGVFTSSSLNNLDTIAVTLTSSASCATSQASNFALANITNTFTPSVSLVQNPSPVCIGDTTTISAIVANGGASPVFQWSLNGAVQASVTGTNFVSDAFANGDIVQVIVTPTESCVTGPDTATIAVNITNAITPTLNLVQSPNPSCINDPVTFFSNGTSTGTNPTFSWTLNGAIQPLEVGPTFTSTTINDNDIVIVTMNSDISCALGPVSDTISAAITNSVTPTVSILQNPNPACFGDTATFTAVASGQGASPVFQWLVNNIVQVGETGATFASNAINDGDTIEVNLTSSASCATSTASGSFIAQFTNAITPTVSLLQSPSPACIGSTVTISASFTGGGSNALFDWFLNGNLQVSNNSNTFSSAAFQNNDTVSVILNSSATCATGSAQSQIILNISDTIIPTVNILQTPSVSCINDTIDFIAIPTNGGSNPSYTWTINGVGQATVGNILRSSTLINGDIVGVTMLSNAQCAFAPANANISANVINSTIANIDSIVYDTTSVCGNLNLQFEALVTGEGSSPIFDWQLNGTSLGINSNIININNLNNNDTLRLFLTSSASCATPNSDNAFLVIDNILNLNPYFTIINPSNCGGSLGAIIIDSVTEGSGNYQFLIDGVDSSSNIFSNLNSANYQIQILDLVSGCAFDTVITINVPGAITASVNTTPVLCSGQSNGQAQFLNLSGGSGFYEISIDTGNTFQSATLFSSLTSGAYQAIIRDSLDPACTFVLNFTIGSSFTISGIIIVDEPSTCSASDAEIEVKNVNGGLAPYSFRLDSAGVLGTFQSSPIFSNLAPGFYDLVIRDANNCELMVDSVEIEGFPPITANIIQSQEISCFGDNDGQISVNNVIGGSGSYLYQINASPLQAGNVFNNLSAGSYLISILDQGSTCTFSFLSDVVEPDSIQLFTTITEPSTCIAQDGSIVLDSVNGGNSNFQFSINNGSFTTNTVFSNLVSSVYTIVAFDSKGCLDTTFVNVTNPNNITAIATEQDVNCFGANTGGLTLTNISGGSAPYEFSIDNVTFTSNTTFNNLPAGLGTYFIRDASACISSYPYEIEQPTQITATLTVNNTTDCDSANGSISVNNVNGGQPGYTYSIGAGFLPSNTFNNLANGIYIVSVRDFLNCTVSFVDTIEQPNQISVGTIVAEDPLCNGDLNGRIELQNVQGGTTPYAFSLNNGPFGSVNLFNALVGDSTYQINVRDAENCTLTLPVSLNEPDSLNFNVATLIDASCGNPTGSASAIDISGGIAPLSFTVLGFDSAQTSTLFDSLTSGNQVMIMTDFNGCQVNRVFTIGGDPAVNYQATANSVSCEGDLDGSIRLNILNGGTAPFTFKLGNGSFSTRNFVNDTLIENLVPGSYELVIRDSNDCVTFHPNALEIAEPDPIVAEFESITMSDPDSASGRVAIYSIQGGTAPFELQINQFGFFRLFQNQSTFEYDTILEFIPSGYQTFTLRDVNGCIESFEVFMQTYQFADRFIVPNVFTPNEDGFNDKFVIEKLPENSRLSIYDKAGRPVFESDNYQSDWDADGYFNGTYYYVLDVPGQGIFRGYVEVFR